MKNTRSRAAVLAAALAGSALIAAGCSSGPSSSSPPASDNGGKTRYQQAVAYSACMRQHGVPSFPDPNSNGTFPNPGTLDLTSPQFQSAANACKSLEPPPNTSQYEQGFRQLLRYSVCMRAHGVPNYPDPVLTSTGVSIQLNAGTAPGDVNTHSPQYAAAQSACRSLEPGGVAPGGHP